MNISKSSATSMTVRSMVELLVENYGIAYEYAVYLMKLPVMEAVEILNRLKEEDENDKMRSTRLS